MQVFKDTLKGVAYGWRTPYGQPFNRSAIDLQRYRTLASPSARCELLAHGKQATRHHAGAGLAYSYHVLDPRTATGPLPSKGEFRGHMSVLQVFDSQLWLEALASLPGLVCQCTDAEIVSLH